jgi:hypothetical protein
MKWQYIFQDSAGNRMIVSASRYFADSRDKKYRQIHAYGTAIIYEMV